MEKEKFWQTLFYASLGIVTLWLILKLAGIIQTPVWLEFGAPIAGLLIAIFALYHKILNGINKIAVSLAKITAKVSHMEKDISTLKNNFVLIREDIALLKHKSSSKRA